MKKLIVFLVIAATVGVCALYLVRSAKPAQTPAEVARLQTELEQKTAQIKELELNRERAEKQTRQIAQLSDDIAAQSKERELALSNSLAMRAAALATKAESGKGNEGKGGMGGMLSGMMKDPEMRKMIREQQAMVMEQLYSPLLKKLNLNPEQAQKFKEILSSGLESGMEMASSMFGGGSTNRAELGKAVAAQHKAQEEQMKELLGEQGFAQYKEYQETVGERAQLNQFRQQFGGDQGISDDQAEQLLALMRQEKKNMTATKGTEFPGQKPGDMEALMKEGSLEKLMEAQADVNQNVYSHAGEILSPEQLASFGKFQTNQLMMMRMGMSMARKFMGGEDKPPTPNQDPAPK